MPPRGSITRPPAEIYGQHLGYGFAGLCVNTAIGNFSRTIADLTFPGNLLGLLDWTRTYNSLSGTAGALGPGWTTAFSARLQVSEQGLLHHTVGQVTFFDEDGRVLPFLPAEGGGFSSPQDLNATLSQNADGSFGLTYLSGETWSFTSAGQLASRSLEGQTVTLTYAANGQLLQASHSLGLHLNLSYDSSGRLTQVESSDGRTVSFGHSADGTLTSVTEPGGGVAQYAFTTAGPFPQVSSITSADGNVLVTNAYDATSQQVTSQSFPTGGGAEFSYGDTGLTTVTSTPSAATVTFQADANGRMTRATDPFGNAATFTYDANGRLTVATTPGGSQLAQSYDASGNVLTSSFGGATSTWIYDSANRIRTATDPDGAVTSYVYPGDSHIPEQITTAVGGIIRITSANGLLTAQTNADGNTTTLGYDSAGNLISIADPLGETWGFSYDAAGNRTQEISPAGRTSTYTYDGAGRLLTFTDPAGATITYQYSAAGLLLQVTDQIGATTGYAYDAAGNQTQITDALSQVTTMAYDADGNMITLTAPDGTATHATYDSLGRLLTVTDPLNVEHQFSYDADGNRLTEQAPNGTTTFGYDARGNTVSTTTSAGEEWRFTYDLDDRETALTEPDGASWLTAYDALGRPIVSTSPLGARTARQWTPASKLASTTDALGRKVSLGYDATGRLTSATSPGGEATTFAYAPDGRKVTTTTPTGQIAQYRYDQAGRLIAVVNARGWITRFRHNTRGDTTEIITPSGAVKHIRYDAVGQITQTVDPNGSPTEYAYNQTGHLISITDAKGAVTRFTYDADGRQISSTDALGRTTTRAYNAAGDLTTITDPDGRTQTLAYDADQRVIERSASDGTTVTFTYDSSGRRSSMTDANGTTHYAYDAAGQLTTVTAPDGGTITSAYDAAGQRTTLTYPDGLELSYRYDQNGRLVFLHDPRAGDAVYALDPDGRLLTEQFPGRLARRYHYEYGRLARFEVIRDGHPVAETSFIRDPDDRILVQRDGDRVREYRYDPAGQLVRLTDRRPGLEPDRFELHLTYDTVGNRTVLRRGDIETRYRYDAADQLLASETGERRIEFQYNSSGRLVEEREGERRRRIDYDGFGRPVRLTRSGAGREERIQATFNGVNLPSALVLTARDEHRNEERAASVRYLWSVGGRIAQIINQQAQPQLDDAEHDQAGRLDADFAYGYGRTFASWEHGAATFHKDAFGSAVRTEDTRAWVQARRYDTFGQPEDEGDADGDGSGRRGLRAPELPRFGYRGELVFGSMIYLRARFYDAAVGRFTSRDPVTTLRGLGHLGNPYVYANNDPLNFVDPRGRLAFGFAGVGAVTAFLAPVKTGGGCAGCPPADANDINSHPKCFQNMDCLLTRGSIPEGALDNNPTVLNSLYSGVPARRELAAHGFTIHALNAMRAGIPVNLTSYVGKVPYDYGVDWEVRSQGVPKVGSRRPDIVLDEKGVMEVRVLSATVVADITEALAADIDYAETGWHGVKLVADSTLSNWAGEFAATARIPITVYVWGLGNKAGHIYFSDSRRAPENVKVRVAASYPGPLTAAGIASMAASDLYAMATSGPKPATQSPPGPIVRSPEYDDPDPPTGGELDGTPVPAKVGAGDDGGDDFGDFFDFF